MKTLIIMIIVISMFLPKKYNIWSGLKRKYEEITNNKNLF